MIVVASLALACAGALPPEIDTWLVTLAGAVAATFPVRVPGGYLAPAANESERLQPTTSVAEQTQPAPCSETAVRPTGSVSSNWTTCPPDVAAVPLLVAVML